MSAGQDQCSIVTAALEAEAKQISDLTKERDGLKAAAAKSAIAAHGGQRTLVAESWEALVTLVPNVWFRPDLDKSTTNATPDFTKDARDEN